MVQLSAAYIHIYSLNKHFLKHPLILGARNTKMSKSLPSRISQPSQSFPYPGSPQSDTSNGSSSPTTNLNIYWTLISASLWTNAGAQRGIRSELPGATDMLINDRLQHSMKADGYPGYCENKGQMPQIQSQGQKCLPEEICRRLLLAHPIASFPSMMAGPAVVFWFHLSSSDSGKL